MSRSGSAQRPQPDDGLADHLAVTGLAGWVATSPASTLTNCSKLVEGDPRYTFGLSDWRDTSLREAVDAVRALCGGDPGGAAEQHGRGWIDPKATLAGASRHRDVLASLTAAGGGRVLIATGHPTGLLGHYLALARSLQAHGCLLVTPLDDVVLDTAPDGRPRSLRFIDGVGAVSDGGSLRHTHRSTFMEAALDALGGARAVDLVIGDHGMAGAAIERGIRTLSIADVNDPALPLAQVRGRTDGVLVMDDNIAPRAYVPLTNLLLDWDR
ncbi:MAG: phosphatase [Euzebyales bacterium]|nr:phosphatase [Euzebyales bacterium]